MQRALWCFVVALLAVDIFVLAERRRLVDSMRNVQEASTVALLKARYTREEEKLLAGAAALPATFSRFPAGPLDVDAVQFVLLVSADDCTNSIEDEVAKLNQIVKQSSRKIAGVQGFFVDEDRPARTGAVIRHLSPPPAFAVTVQNALAHLPGATTPLVLVIRSRDGRILDAHKPIPQDDARRDAFYSRWGAILGLS